MKKLLVIFVMVLGVVSSAFAETKSYNNGQVTAYLSGDRVEIVDNNNNTCIVITATTHRNAAGEILYNLACGNKYTKNLTKFALKTAIGSLITSASSVAGPSGAATGAAISAVAMSIAGDASDDMCNHFGQ